LCYFFCPEKAVKIWILLHPGISLITIPFTEYKSLSQILTWKSSIFQKKTIMYLLKVSSSKKWLKNFTCLHINEFKVEIF
jgi:hypothetical protein